MSQRASDLVAHLIESACIITILGCALFGCASPEVNQLLMRQRQVQDCILGGGHPHAGPGDTIICE